MGYMIGVAIAPGRNALTSEFMAMINRIRPRNFGDGRVKVLGEQRLLEQRGCTVCCEQRLLEG